MSRTGISEQIHVADYLRAQFFDTEIVWTAINPRPYHASKADIGNQKKMGLNAGWPDYIILRPNLPPVFLEVKSGDKPHRSKSQKDFMAFASRLGAVTFIVRTPEDVEDALISVGMITKQSFAKNKC